MSLFNQYEEVDPARLQQLKNVIAKLLHLSTNPEVPSLLSFQDPQSIIPSTFHSPVKSFDWCYYGFVVALVRYVVPSCLDNDLKPFRKSFDDSGFL